MIENARQFIERVPRPSDVLAEAPRAAMALVVAFALATTCMGAGLAGFLLGRCSAPEPAAPIEAEVGRGLAEVVRVVDGDTIVVRAGGQEETVRLLCIDTPERGEPYFASATTALQELLPNGSRVSIVREPKLDRWGRTLGYVFSNGRNASVEMVRLGWSPYWTEYGNSPHEAEFSAAEREAKARQTGIWN